MWRVFSNGRRGEGVVSFFFFSFSFFLNQSFFCLYTNRIRFGAGSMTELFAMMMKMMKIAMVNRTGDLLHTDTFPGEGGRGGGLDVAMNYDIFCPGNPSVSERTTSYYITSIVLPEGEQPGREA